MADGSAPKPPSTPVAETPTSEVLPSEAVAYHLGQMEDWIAGRRSTWNTYAMGEDRIAALAHCERADAAWVAKHADAARAYAALIGTGCTVPDPAAKHSDDPAHYTPDGS